ncbi:MAG: polyhydroxyalkanoic acid system family protein [Pseudomonadota bacterium]|jgi:putative polyhydroxyalkanoate system protein
MTTIDFRRPNTIGTEQAREAVEAIARELRHKLDIRYQWHGNVLEFDRPGADGTIRLTDHEVRFEARLGLLLRPLKGVIESEVEAYFDKYFGKG